MSQGLRIQTATVVREAGQIRTQVLDGDNVHDSQSFVNVGISGVRSNGSSSSTFFLTQPTATKVGDLIVAVIEVYDVGPSVSIVPQEAGWTQVNVGQETFPGVTPDVAVYVFIREATQASQTFTFAGSGAAAFEGVTYSVSGVDTSQYVAAYEIISGPVSSGNVPALSPPWSGESLHFWAWVTQGADRDGVESVIEYSPLSLFGLDAQPGFFVEPSGPIAQKPWTGNANPTYTISLALPVLPDAGPNGIGFTTTDNLFANTSAPLYSGFQMNGSGGARANEATLWVPAGATRARLELTMVGTAADGFQMYWRSGETVEQIQLGGVFDGFGDEGVETRTVVIEHEFAGFEADPGIAFLQYGIESGGSAKTISPILVDFYRSAPG